MTTTPFLVFTDTSGIGRGSTVGISIVPTQLYPLSDCVGVLWEHDTEELRLGLMLSCGSTQTRYFELTIRQKGENDNGEE